MSRLDLSILSYLCNRAACGFLLACLVPAFALVASPASAQTQNQQNQEMRGADAPTAVPGFWDPRRRPERPDTSRITMIRFLTETDYPPFNYAGADGNPTGFNVDLARAICDELKIPCTIQMRRFDTLVPALTENRGDAIVASISVTAETRKLLDFSDPYYRAPARFVVRKGDAVPDLRPEMLEGKRVAVVSGSAHEAYLKLLFTEADLKSYPSADAAREALKKKEVDLLFGDAISLSFWLNGTESHGCCAFSGGAFFDSRYFGEGVGIAVRRGNDTLRAAFNWALFRLWEKGKFSDLWLRYFPVVPF